MISAVKDTAREFSEYIEEADRLYGNANTDDSCLDEETDVLDEDSRDSQDKPYTPEEAEICRDCLMIMRRGEETLKLSLSFTTEVMDRSRESGHDVISSSSRWMANVHSKCLLLMEGVVDLSSELFVPFDLEAIQTKFTELKEITTGVLQQLLDGEMIGGKGVSDSGQLEIEALLASTRSCNLR